MRVSIIGVGVVVALFGGSPMSNTTTWSVLGPVILLVGVAVAVAGSRIRR